MFTLDITGKIESKIKLQIKLMKSFEFCDIFCNRSAEAHCLLLSNSNFLSICRLLLLVV